MGEKFSKLYEISDKLHKSEKFKKGSQLTESTYLEPSESTPSGMYKMKEIFTTLNNMMVEWGNTLKQQI